MIKVLVVFETGPIGHDTATYFFSLFLIDYLSRGGTRVGGNTLSTRSKSVDEGGNCTLTLVDLSLHTPPCE